MRFKHRHSGARPQALNPESRYDLAFTPNNFEIPGSIVTAQALCAFALTIAPE